VGNPFYYINATTGECHRSYLCGRGEYVSAVHTPSSDTQCTECAHGYYMPDHNHEHRQCLPWRCGKGTIYASNGCPSELYFDPRLWWVVVPPVYAIIAVAVVGLYRYTVQAGGGNSYTIRAQFKV